MKNQPFVGAAGLAVTLLTAIPAFSNNIQVSNISLTGQDQGANTVQVEFDLQWENSWRTSVGPSNWDAAWVFIKYRSNGGSWNHATLNFAGHNPAPGSVIERTSDGVGALVYRDADGNGDVNWQNMQLRWSYGGLADTALVDIQVFALEMVYVPEGPFYVGGTSGDEANKFHSANSTTTSYQVTSEAAITVGAAAGNLNYVQTNSGAGDGLGPIPAAFPKGFAAYYCMKYEISQGQWVDFFNSLTDTQKDGRDITGPAGKNSDLEVSRNTIAWTSGAATTATPDIALNHNSVSDLLAYFDWSGLRPMSELEFEKSCRGPNLPVAGEFAWGTANIHGSPYSLSSAGTPTEAVTNPGIQIGNAAYTATNGTPSGPKRCGIFAASSPNHTREETGGSYYGIMELSGNIYERAVTVGTPQGRSFSGNHGNGIIGSTGNSTAGSWPNQTTGDGYGYRSGSYTNGSDFLRVSDRYDGANLISSANGRLGGRGVRTAP